MGVHKNVVHLSALSTEAASEPALFWMSQQVPSPLWFNCKKQNRWTINMKLLQRIILKMANASFILLLDCEAQHLNYLILHYAKSNMKSNLTFLAIPRFCKHCIWLQWSSLTKIRQIRYNSLLRSMLNKEQELENNGWHIEKSCKLSSSRITQCLEYSKLEGTNKDYQVQLLNVWPVTLMFVLIQETNLKIFPEKTNKSRIK